MLNIYVSVGKKLNVISYGAITEFLYLFVNGYFMPWHC